MSGRSHPFGWLPPFLVGVCAASAAEIAVGLLLYAGPGLMRSLNTVLAVEAGALAVGLWSAPRPRPDLLDSLRRRWLFCLAAFLAATLFSAFWSAVQSVGGSGLSQGLGLAFLAGLPLYACGGVLGSMATAAASDPEGRVGAVGAAAAIGGALGFAATGVSLPQVLTPASLFLVCLVLLSGGGLIYGAVLDTRLRVHIRAMRPSVLGPGNVTVEERHLLARDQAARLLLEGGCVRRWETLGDGDRVSWDAAAHDGFRPAGDGPYRVLVVGGGASSLPRRAVHEHPTVRVDVLERSGAVLEMAREHFETGLFGESEGRVTVRVGNLDDLVTGEVGPYDLVVLDAASLAPIGGLKALSSSARSALLGALASGGVFVLGPALVEEDAWLFPEGWRTARYTRSMPIQLDGLGVCLPDSELLIIGTRAGTEETSLWPEALEGFSLEVESAT